jgi:hypothetical protein
MVSDHAWRDVSSDRAMDGRGVNPVIGDCLGDGCVVSVVPAKKYHDDPASRSDTKTVDGK